MGIISWTILGLGILYLLSGLRIIRPTERGLVETFGKYKRFGNPGLNYVFTFIQKLIKVNITETMIDARRQEIITNDNLNASVDAQVYFKVRSDENSVKASQYNVFDYKYQIVNLARTTLRNIIGTLTLKSANSERDKINDELMKTLVKETKNWGIDVVRTELKEIEPPADVQETMNKVVKAENEKVAAVDFATAKETEADGIKRAAIKEAEGIARGRIIVAEADAKKIELVNKAAQRFFVGNAQKLKQFEVVNNSLENNSKIVLGENGKGILKLFDLNK